MHQLIIPTPLRKFTGGLGVFDAQCVEIHAVEPGGQVEQRGVAVRAHGRDDVRDSDFDVGVLGDGGPRQRGPAGVRVELCPRQDLQPGTHASIFSIGTTCTELAPTAFNASRVSQKMFSRHTT